jgi:hypothetical protein
LKETITLSPGPTEEAMQFTGIADPEQLSVLTRVFEGHCQAHGIGDGSGKDEAARLVMALFRNGASTAQELTAGLAQSAQCAEPNRRRAVKRRLDPLLADKNPD